MPRPDSRTRRKRSISKSRPRQESTSRSRQASKSLSRQASKSRSKKRRKLTNSPTDSLDDSVDIKYYSDTKPKVEEESTTLIKLFDYNKLQKGPPRIYKLRSVLQDFNKILQQEQIGFKARGTDFSLKARTGDNCRTDFPKRTALHDEYNNMCFYCGKEITRDDSIQCDHIIPIIQMLISVKSDKNILMNFERVHSDCNLKADNKSIQELWNLIGKSDKFPGPSGRKYAIPEVLTEKNKEKENQKWCRGYLGKKILTQLELVPDKTQQARLLNIENAIKTLDESIEDLSKLILYPETDVEAAELLMQLSIKH